MKKIITLLMVGMAVFTAANAQTWSENFDSGIPSTWMMYNDGKAPNSTYFSASLVTTLTNNAWTTLTLSGSNQYALTTSSFATAGKADRWLITPKFNVTSANMYLAWQDEAFDLKDSLQILVSTTDSAKTSFTTTIYNQEGTPGTTIGAFGTHSISLGAYNGKNIRLAFRDNSTNQYVLLLDNVSTLVVPSADLALTSVSPTANDQSAYGLAGTNITISGTVTNNGYTPVTAYTVYYQQGANAPVSQAVTDNIALTGTGTFTISAPYVLPNTNGAYPIKVWVSLTGDANHANDSLNTQLSTVSYFPNKHLTFEEGTGTWCGWCVRGIVFMDSARTLYSNDPTAPTLIAVHDQDPMSVTAYDNFVSSHISGYPSVLVDRREVIDPSSVLDAYNNENAYFGFADITLSTPKIVGTQLSVTASVKPATNLSGDYRLVLVLTEDGVHGTTTAWDQHNYYSSSSQNQALSGQGVNYQTSPNPIPAAKMYFQFVARSITPSVTGTAGGLPTTMTAGTTYTQTLTATLASTWSRWLMSAHVLLLSNANGQVLNSQTAKIDAGVQNVEAGISELSLFPNPAGNESMLKVTLTKASSATLIITDITGNIIYKNEAGQLSPDTYIYNIPTANMSNGLYLVSFRTENGVMTQKLVVAH